MSEPGDTLRKVFEDTLLDIKGVDVFIYQNWQSEQMSNTEAKAIKERGRPHFEFPISTRIQKDDVLQIKGGHDFWRVLDTEEEYKYGTAIKLHVAVVKIDQSGSEISLNAEGKATYYSTNIQGHNYGGIQQGGSGNRQEITLINNQPISEILPKLAELIEAVKRADFDDKEDVVRDLEKAQELAIANPNATSKEGIWKRIQGKLDVAKTGMEIVGFAYESLPYWPVVWKYFFG